MNRIRIADTKDPVGRSRVLKIRRVPNFRDLGGYQTRDGQRVKWGLLFRSAQLSDLTSHGLANLTNLNLNSIIDFRSNSEAEKQPDVIPIGTRYLNLPVMDKANREMSKEIRERMKTRDYEGYSPVAQIRKAYQQFPTEFTPEFKAFIHAVREANGNPVLWHCRAGKDRTGYAAAILLRVLGVDQDTIYSDYLLSNQYGKKVDKRMLAVLFVRGVKAYQMVKPLMGVQLEWLSGAFEFIDKKWGSFDSYVSDGLDLSPSDVLRMKDALLE